MDIAINTLSLNRTKAGMGNYIRNLVNTLASIDKHNRYHIFVSEANKRFFEIKPGNSNIKIINLGNSVTKSFFRLLWEQISLPRYIKKNKIDVLHSPGFAIPLMSGAKNIVTIADMTFITFPRVHTLMKRLYFGIMMPYSIRNADRVIAISESTKKDILHNIKVEDSKIKVIHLAQGNEFRKISKEKSKDYVKKKYAIDGPFLLFVGMIEPRKNLAGILKAFMQLKKHGLRHKLVIVGKKGWMYKKALGLIKKMKLDDVVFTGFVPDDDLVRFYNAADVFLYPCLYEGFGIPILEAMACGCPVITSKISSMPEVAGDAALLVDPNETQQIESAISMAINDSKLRNSMIKKGLKRSSQFSWQRCAKETLRIYEETA